jgi:hypothetical protein
MKPHAKIKKLNLTKQILGKNLGTNQNGHAGRQMENMLEDMGVEINRGHGPDIKRFGLEVKTRERDAVSAQTIATMHINDIVDTDYEHSHVREKFQQQLRVYTKQGTVTHADVYDFSAAWIQHTVKIAYDHARQQLIQANSSGAHIACTRVNGHFGYFESRPDSPNTYSFRVSAANMNRFERMTQSTFGKFFDFE